MFQVFRQFHRQLGKYIDIRYCAWFIVLMLSFYYFNVFYICITDHQGRLYSAFLEQHLNYIAWLRNSILYTSNGIAHLFGIQSYVDLPYNLRTVHGKYVEMVYACLGLGLKSFWLAFVLAHKDSIAKKITWGLGGLLCIWVINCIRVAILLMAFEWRWKVNKMADHHTIFNICAYILIGILIYAYSRANKNKEISDPSNKTMISGSAKPVITTVHHS